MIRFSFLIFINYFILMVNSYAYLEPGTLTIIVQTIIAGIATALVYFKYFYRKVIDFFKKIHEKIFKRK